jgi:hypothetical protein
VLVVWKLDRLGRSLLDLVALVETLKAKGAGLKVLAGHGATVDPTTANGRLIFGIFAAPRRRAAAGFDTAFSGTCSPQATVPVRPPLKHAATSNILQLQPMWPAAGHKKDHGCAKSHRQGCYPRRCWLGSRAGLGERDEDLPFDRGRRGGYP